MSSIVQKISPEIENIAKNLNLYLIDIKYFKENDEFMLEIYLDSKGGLTMDQCEEATKEINKYLDETDPIKDTYTLIVSSPGLYRPLVTDLDLTLAIDNMVEVKLKTPSKGKYELIGVLKDFSESSYFLVDDNDNLIDIKRSEVKKISKAIII